MLGTSYFFEAKNLYCSAKIRIPVMEILFTHFRRADDSRSEKLISNIKGTVKRLDQETYFVFRLCVFGAEANFKPDQYKQ